jgi:hypothetical protein
LDGRDFVVIKQNVSEELRAVVEEEADRQEEDRNDEDCDEN